MTDVRLYRTSTKDGCADTYSEAVEVFASHAALESWADAQLAGLRTSGIRPGDWESVGDGLVRPVYGAYGTAAQMVLFHEHSSHAEVRG